MNDMSFEELQQIVSICLDEIVKLKDENAKLREGLKSTNISLTEILNSQKQLVKNSDIIAGNNEIRFKVLEGAIDNLKYELNDPEMDKTELYYPLFYSIEETLNDIIVNKKSLARFGDGEFAIMSKVVSQKFQRIDDALVARLKEVISYEDDGFLVGIADNYGSLEKYNESGKAGIRYYMKDEVRKQHAEFIDINRKYHNAYISRPYALFADNLTDAPKKRFEALRQIWNGRNVIFVEGALTRLGVGNDLFDNAARIRRIEAPPVNSFDKYDEILAAALKYAEEDTLFLIAMGPSAGVLAYDLYKAGHQAIDIGHVDLEYEWFLNGDGKRSAVKHKYNNEFPNGDCVEDIYDEEYLRQIICIIE